MNNELTYSQIEELKKRMRNGTFDVEYEVKNLIVLGYDPEIASQLIIDVVKGFKEQLFYEVKEAKEADDKENVAWFVVWMSSLLIAMLGNNNSTLIFVSVVIACAAGYLGFPKRPIPAMAAFVTGSLIMPFACGYYFKNRETFLNIEMIIPAAISFGPALLVKYLLNKLMYSDED